MPAESHPAISSLNLDRFAASSLHFFSKAGKMFTLLHLTLEAGNLLNATSAEWL